MAGSYLRRYGWKNRLKNEAQIRAPDVSLGDFLKHLKATSPRRELRILVIGGSRRAVEFMQRHPELASNGTIWVTVDTSSLSEQRGVAALNPEDPVERGILSNLAPDVAIVLTGVGSGVKTERLRALTRAGILIIEGPDASTAGLGVTESEEDSPAALEMEGDRLRPMSA